MTKILKRPLSIILAVLMVCSLFVAVPTTASAGSPGDSGAGSGIGGSTAVITPTTAGDDYLTFTAEEANSSVTMEFNYGSNFMYNKNDSGWQSYTAGTAITLNNVGDYVRFSGKDTEFNEYNHVSLTGKVAASGSVMSLRLSGGESQGLSNYCFSYMFDYCAGLTTAPELPETTLAKNCYFSMFRGCTSLTTAPVLPATTLAKNCYSYMFRECENLTELPALPATTLADSCYYYMFYDCPKIRISDVADTFDGITYSVPYRIPTTGTGTSANNALYRMFLNTGGKFTDTPNINTTYYLPAPAPTTHTITWNNYDDSLITSDEVEDGETPVYSGATPAKAADDDYTYTFAGWTPSVVAATADATYTATFTSTPKYESGIYLIGSMTDWKVDPAYKLTQNPNNSSEYMLTNVQFDSNTEFKAAYAAPGESKYWYPDNAPNCTINDGGTYDVYVRPDGQGGEGWYYGSIFVTASAPAGNTLKASDLSTGDTIGTDFTSFDPEDYTFVLKAYRFCSGIGYEPDVKSRDFSFTAADDNFTLKVIDGTLVAFYDWGDDPDTYRFVDHDGDPTNTAYVLRADHTNKKIILGGYTGEYFLYEPLTENTAKITGYDGVATELTIPSEIDGYTITAIGEGAFENNESTSITIPNTVTSIGELAFVECDNLTSITIPASVTSIGFAAFADCDAMETVIFERPSAQQNLTFGENVFYDNEATLSFTGSGDYSLYREDTEIPADTSASTLGEGTYTWKAPAAAPTYDYVTDGENGYNFDDTIGAGVGDILASANNYTTLYNFKILGVQKKVNADELSSAGGKDVRFVSVVNTDILKDADEYGYVFAKFDSKEDARDYCDEIQAGGSKVLTMPCTATDNTISGDYGIYNEDTAYKYVTATVNGIGDDTVAARFYVRKGSTYYYADYTDSNSQTYGVCATAFSDLV